MTSTKPLIDLIDVIYFVFWHRILVPLLPFFLALKTTLTLPQGSMSPQLGLADTEPRREPFTPTCKEMEAKEGREEIIMNSYIKLLRSWIALVKHSGDETRI